MEKCVNEWVYLMKKLRKQLLCKTSITFLATNALKGEGSKDSEEYQYTEYSVTFLRHLYSPNRIGSS